jgi:Lipocalin-like domain
MWNCAHETTIDVSRGNGKCAGNAKYELQRYSRTRCDNQPSAGMKKLLLLTAAALLALLGGFVSPGRAVAETAKGPLTGSSWRLVSGTVDRGGKKVRFNAPRLQGFLVFDSNDHFLIVLTHFGRPRGIQPAWQKSVACFGTYAINESDHTISAHIDGSTFPKWVGSDQQRQFTLVGDTLQWNNSSASGPGTTADLVWKRVR